MIVLLRTLLEENKEPMFVEYIKSQMMDLYNQLSTCKELKTNLFLYISQVQDIFVDIDETFLIKGTISTIIEQKMIHNGGLVCHIEDVVVHEKYRGQKIGQQLMDYAISHAKRNKCYKIILNCNDNVEEFYQKMGFTCKNKEMSMYFK